MERTALTGVHFRGDSGSAYQFRITAVDRAANRTAIVTDPLVLPVDDRDRGLWRSRARLEAEPLGLGLGPHGRAGRARPARPRRCASPAARSR